MTRKQRRLSLIAAAGTVIALALGLVLYAMSDSIVFYHDPTGIAGKGVTPGTRLRLGGLVKAGSVRRGEDQEVAFEVEDANASLLVRYRGILPDLFQEGRGVVAEGVLDPGGTFRADTVLARHDETYMPREVADTLRQQGHWQGQPKRLQQARP